MIRARITLACAILLGALPAQSHGPRHVQLRTGDGSRFLLVPTGGPPVVHWVIATPAGVLEDPPGLDGLAFATARAAMRGTGFASSRDPEAERAALADEDRLEQDYDRHLAAGEPLDADALAALQEARAKAARLCDPLAWERSLRAAPAIAAELSQVTEGTLLHITTSYTGLPRTAQLLLERREGPVLRGIHREFRLVREELSRRRSRGPRDTMRREVLGLCFLGHPYARAYAVPDKPRPLSRAQALEVYRRTQHPTRTFHVLTGGFDVDQVTATLQKVFARTGLPPVDPPPPPPPPEGGVERRSTLLGGRAEATSIGFRLPPRTDPTELAVLIDWLAVGPEAYLARALRQNGFPRAEVWGTAPFPGRAHGLFLLEVEDSPDDAGAVARGLDPKVEAALVEAAAHGPTAEEVARSVARVTARTAAAKLGPENLALRLALACGLEGWQPDDVLDAAPAIDAEHLRELAGTLLAPTNRAVVTLEAVP